MGQGHDGLWQTLDRPRPLQQRSLPDPRTVGTHYRPHQPPEMAAYEEHLQDTIRSGQRRQDPLQPQKYWYVQAFENLAAANTHLVAIVLCRFSEGEGGRPVPNNYIVTAYQQEIG